MTSIGRTALVMLAAAVAAPAGPAVAGGTGPALRNLCRYPKVSTYRGHGDPHDAASYRCTPGRT